METFEYTIVEKLVLNHDDLKEFSRKVEQHLNDGWLADSTNLVVTENSNGLSSKFYQPLIRVTHVKNPENDKGSR